MFAKETNDQAIISMVDALIAHQGVLLRNNTDVDDKVLKLVSSGLMDKRIKVKSSWAVAVSECIWAVSNLFDVNPSLVSFSTSVAKNLLLVFNEVASNAMQASQNGTLISGYAISAAALGRWFEWQDAQLGSSLMGLSNSSATN
jgi:Generalcontrol nonderepressible 1 (Gcn1) N-terminal